MGLYYELNKPYVVLWGSSRSMIPHEQYGCRTIGCKL